MMDEKRWWLVEGVIVEHKHTNILRHYADTFYFKGQECNLIPRGVPFNCMPEWTELIVFNDIGEFAYFGSEGGEPLSLPLKCLITFPNCPEEWKGKRYEIIDELRELLK